jgi:hypothetical protein
MSAPHGLLTVEQTRQKARVILGEAAISEDPAKRSAQRRLELSMSDLIDLYEEEGCFILRGKRQGDAGMCRQVLEVPAGHARDRVESAEEQVDSHAHQFDVARRAISDL